MKWIVVLLSVASSSCNGGEARKTLLWIDASEGGTSHGCNLLTQQGCQATEKCSWVIDATTPMYVGHVACVPDNYKNVGDACSYYGVGATGYDDCKKGSVCSAYAAPGAQGICKEICDLAGGNPVCNGAQMCVAYPDLFATGAMSPTTAGVCDAS